MSITQLTHDRSRSSTGLSLCLLSGATFATSGSLADSLMRTGWTPAAVVTLRITLAALLLTAPALFAMRGHWHQLRGSVPSILAFGMVAVGGCQLFFFSAVNRLDVGIALLLEYLGILFVVLWMWVRHGQAPRRLTVIGGAAALAGLVLVLNPSTGTIDPIGVLWALLAATGLAIYFVMSANADDDALPPIALAWATLVVGAALLLVLDLLHVVAFRMRTADVVLFDHSMSWVVPVVGVALVSTAVAYAAGIAGTRVLGAKLASFVGLTEVLFAVLIAWLLLGQSPGLVQLVGGLIVLGGIVAVRLDDRDVIVTTPAEPVLAQA